MRISDWSSDVCSSDLRMAGQYLLDQCRSGARHAEHEDRIAGFASPTLALRKEFRSECCDGPIDLCADLRAIIIELLAAEAIALGIMVERLVVTALVLQRLGKREMEMKAIIRRQAIQIGRAL